MMYQLILGCSPSFTGYWKIECIVSHVTESGNALLYRHARHPVGVATETVCSFSMQYSMHEFNKYVFPEPGFPQIRIGWEEIE